jgi:uncharacterized membrane protein (DUF4010 family)
MRERFGMTGLYTVAAISGLTDVDAITLSTSQLVGDGRVDPAAGWRIVTVAVLSNLVFKTGIVAALGSRPMLWKVAGVFAATAAVAVLLILFWPDYAISFGF